MIAIPEEKLMKILLAEQDPHLASYVAEALHAEHYGVELAQDAEQARQLALAERYDLMVLDLGGRTGGGETVLPAVRAARPGLPVLVLAESARVEERVEILDAGADDLLAKPFAMAEMHARIRALLRRSGPMLATSLVVSDLKLDRMERRVERDGQPISLSGKEFALLEYLMLHAGRTVSRTQIIVDVWHLATGITTNVVDVYINYLRRKVDGGTRPRLIHTVRGTGYRLSPPVTM
jgi:DNA-binding response OmpR family regulator